MEVPHVTRNLPTLLGLIALLLGANPTPARAGLPAATRARIDTVRSAPRPGKAFAVIRAMPELKPHLTRSRKPIAFRSWSWFSENPLVRHGLEYSIQLAKTKKGDVRLYLGKTHLKQRETSPYSWSRPSGWTSTRRSLESPGRFV
jgi:hypothetical protein